MCLHHGYFQFMYTTLMFLIQGQQLKSGQTAFALFLEIWHRARQRCGCAWYNFQNNPWTKNYQRTCFWYLVEFNRYLFIATFVNRRRKIKMYAYSNQCRSICWSFYTTWRFEFCEMPRVCVDGQKYDCACRLQWNLSVTTTSIIKYITCDLFSNVF